MASAAAAAIGKGRIARWPWSVCYLSTLREKGESFLHCACGVLCSHALSAAERTHVYFQRSQKRLGKRVLFCWVPSADLENIPRVRQTSFVKRYIFTAGRKRVKIWKKVLATSPSKTAA